MSHKSEKLSQASRRVKIQESHHEHRDGSKFRKVVPKIAMGEQDQVEGRGTKHERIREQPAEGSKIGAMNTQRIRDVHAVESSWNKR